MNSKRIALAITLAMVISFCIVPVTFQATTAPADPTAAPQACSQDLDSAARPPVPGPKCIPCSPNKPCVNPLTVCTYSGSSTHGCCLGYAGQN